ncbi:MAG TPA: di-trans,poly-cis-decaprenylcistransferase [Candidatus Portnoybacteria bacterium]|nr:di-trans,poly-cis-decaprenylcistransferase [Candidatus Portnoybacteria bacterium]
MILPKHIGLIMDGNRRWAKEKGRPTFLGHRQGYEVLKKIPDWLYARGVKYITTWAFSTENWKREKEEVSYLLNLFREAFKRDFQKYANDGYKILISGRISDFPADIQELSQEITEKTKNNQKATLNVGLSYGGRAEIIDAVKGIIQDNLSAEKITPDVFQKYLYQPDLPDIDLVVRTSGEQRLSGFSPWQSVYAEIIFLKKYWPDFNEEDVDFVLEEFSKRQRRFGGG